MMTEVKANGAAGAGIDAMGASEILIAILIGLIVWLLMGLVLTAGYCQTMSRTVRLCHPRNRRMKSAEVWWNLCPIVQTIFAFISLIKITDMLRDEFDDRGVEFPRTEDFGRSHGMVANVCFALTAFAGLFPLSSIIGYGFWISHWLHLIRLNRLLEHGESFAEGVDAEYRRRYDDDDDDDEEDDSDDELDEPIYDDDDRDKRR